MNNSELSYTDHFNTILSSAHELKEHKTSAQETLQKITFLQKLISALNQSSWRVKFGLVCFAILPFTFVYDAIPEEVVKNQTFHNIYTVGGAFLFVGALIVVLTQLYRFDVKYKHKAFIEEKLSQILLHVEKLKKMFNESEQIQIQTVSDFCHNGCSIEDSNFLRGLFASKFFDIHEVCLLFDKSYAAPPTLNQFLMYSDEY